MTTSTMPNYYDLFEIYANSTATGKYSRAGKDLGAKDGVCNVVSSPKDADNEVAGGGHEEESQSDDEIEICDLKSKHKPMAPPCPQQPKKAKKSTGEGMVDALSAMALAATSLVEKKKESNNATKSINVVEALNAIPDLDDGLYMDACDLLEDKGKAKFFVE